MTSFALVDEQEWKSGVEVGDRMVDVAFAGIDGV